MNTEAETVTTHFYPGFQDKYLQHANEHYTLLNSLRDLIAPVLNVTSFIQKFKLESMVIPNFFSDDFVATLALKTQIYIDYIEIIKKGLVSETNLYEEELATLRNKENNGAFVAIKPNYRSNPQSIEDFEKLIQDCIILYRMYVEQTMNNYTLAKDIENLFMSEVQKKKSFLSSIFVIGLNLQHLKYPSDIFTSNDDKGENVYQERMDIDIFNYFEFEKLQQFNNISSEFIDKIRTSLIPLTRFYQAQVRDYYKNNPNNLNIQIPIFNENPRTFEDFKKLKETYLYFLHMYETLPKPVIRH